MQKELGKGWIYVLKATNAMDKTKTNPTKSFENMENKPRIRLSTPKTYNDREETRSLRHGNRHRRTNISESMKVANMMLAPVRPASPKLARKPLISYITETEHVSAITATYLAQPYLIKWKKRANQILKLYKTNRQ